MEVCSIIALTENLKSMMVHSVHVHSRYLLLRFVVMWFQQQSPP